MGKVLWPWQQAREHDTGGGRAPPQRASNATQSSGSAEPMPLARTLAFQAPVARSAVGSGATGLRVSSPDDVEEREADHIADKVMRSADLPRDPSTAVTEAPIVHRSSTGGQTQQPGPHVDSGAGHPLDRS